MQKLEFCTIALSDFVIPLSLIFYLDFWDNPPLICPHASCHIFKTTMTVDLQTYASSRYNNEIEVCDFGMRFLYL